MIRRACAVLGLLGLFLQGSGGGHMLLVEHAKCEKHGELVHGTQGHVERTGTESVTSLRSASSPESETAHDHCLLAAERRDAMEPVVAWLTDVVRIEVRDRVDDVGVGLSEKVPRFQVAPKNSPPA